MGKRRRKGREGRGGEYFEIFVLIFHRRVYLYFLLGRGINALGITD